MGGQAEERCSEQEVRFVEEDIESSGGTELAQVLSRTQAVIRAYESGFVKPG